MVLSLVRAGNMLDFVFTRDEVKAARKRISRMIQEAIQSRALMETIEEIEAAVTSLVISTISS